MNQAETEFLALTALGMFTVDEQGRVWRHKEWTRGSRNGSDPALVALPKKRRADVSRSGQRENRANYLRVMFVAKRRRWSVHAHRVVERVVIRQKSVVRVELAHVQPAAAHVEKHQAAEQQPEHAEPARIERQVALDEAVAHARNEGT